MLQELTLDAFVPHIGGRFRIFLSADRAIEAELVEARALSEQTGPQESPARKRVPFSLVFRTPGSDYAPQQIYRVEHDTLGSYDIFLVPIGPDGTGMRYEAIFT